MRVTAPDKEYDQPLPARALNLDDKVRSSTFPWRGQFSPELVENLIEAYCPADVAILDPFCGSGTVLRESGTHGFEAVGIELNPAAHILSKTYTLMNLSTATRRGLLAELTQKVYRIFPEPGLSELPQDKEALSVAAMNELLALKASLNPEETILFNTLVILLDVNNHVPTAGHLHTTFSRLVRVVEQLPFCARRVRAIHGDARSIPLPNGSVGFALTSPPYINVFNYHQNYRRSAELLGWDLLKIARSEIGSNRANRGNRFRTVIQYCLDMVSNLSELYRVCSDESRLIFVVGHESRVLGVPFYNASIIASLATETGLFRLVLRQNRRFKNKYGMVIREDLLHLRRETVRLVPQDLAGLARSVALRALEAATSDVSANNKGALQEAIGMVPSVDGTPYYRADCPDYYRNSHEQHQE